MSDDDERVAEEPYVPSYTIEYATKTPAGDASGGDGDGGDSDGEARGGSPVPDADSRGRMVLSTVSFATPDESDIYYRGFTTRGPFWHYQARRMLGEAAVDERGEPLKPMDVLFEAVKRNGRLLFFQTEEQEGMRCYLADGTRKVYKWAKATFERYNSPARVAARARRPRPEDDKHVPSYYEALSVFPNSTYLHYMQDIEMEQCEAELMLDRMGVSRELTPFERNVVLLDAIVAVVVEALHGEIDPLQAGLRVAVERSTSSNAGKFSFHAIYKITDASGRLYFFESMSNLRGFHREVIMQRFFHCRACGTRYTSLMYCNRKRMPGTREPCPLYKDAAAVPPGVYVAETGWLKLAADALIYNHRRLMRPLGSTKWSKRLDPERSFGAIGIAADGTPVPPRLYEFPSYDVWVSHLVTFVPPSSVIEGLFCWVPGRIAARGTAYSLAFAQRLRDPTVVRNVQSVARMGAYPGLSMIVDEIAKVDLALTGDFTDSPSGLTFRFASRSKSCHAAGREHSTNHTFWQVRREPGAVAYRQGCFSGNSPGCALDCRAWIPIGGELGRRISEEIANGVPEEFDFTADNAALEEEEAEAVRAMEEAEARDALGPDPDMEAMIEDATAFAEVSALALPRAELAEFGDAAVADDDDGGADDDDEVLEVDPAFEGLADDGGGDTAVDGPGDGHSAGADSDDEYGTVAMAAADDGKTFKWTREQGAGAASVPLLRTHSEERAKAEQRAFDLEGLVDLCFY